MGAHVKLTFIFVDANSSSVKTNDITNFVSNWEIFETFCVNNNSCEVIIGWFTALRMKGGIDNLNRSNILVS